MKIVAGDLTLGYEEAGAGIPLVLVHGFPSNRALWSAQLRGLSRQCRCIAPDVRGFGESDVAPPYSMDTYADDVAHLLDALEIERAVIGGQSMGGYITFAFWRRHRDRVLGLVLADTRAQADTPDAIAKRHAMMALARAQGASAVADEMVAGSTGKSTRRRHPELVDSVRAMYAAAPVEAITGALEAMASRPDSTPTLATIDVPTLIVVGEEDVLTPVADSRALHASIAGSRLEILKGAGHVSNAERPAAFNHVLGEFMHELAQ
ncbi:MAG: alpha/beta fold hydrolase [Gemmatimonadaceae bacterium]